MLVQSWRGQVLGSWSLGVLGQALGIPALLAPCQLRWLAQTRALGQGAQSSQTALALHVTARGSTLRYPTCFSGRGNPEQPLVRAVAKPAVSFLMRPLATQCQQLTRSHVFLEPLYE